MEALSFPKLENDLCNLLDYTSPSFFRRGIVDFGGEVSLSYAEPIFNLMMREDDCSGFWFQLTVEVSRADAAHLILKKREEFEKRDFW